MSSSGAYPSRADLDSLVSDRPVFLFQLPSHRCVQHACAGVVLLRASDSLAYATAERRRGSGCAESGGTAARRRAQSGRSLTETHRQYAGNMPTGIMRETALELLRGHIDVESKEAIYNRFRAGPSRVDHVGRGFLAAHWSVVVQVLPSAWRWA
jgi:predicted amidohydrolase YtcJ